jgi:hypothetical protein
LAESASISAPGPEAVQPGPWRIVRPVDICVQAAWNRAAFAPDSHAHGACTPAAGEPRNTRHVYPTARAAPAANQEEPAILLVNHAPGALFALGSVLGDLDADLVTVSPRQADRPPESAAAARPPGRHPGTSSW